MAEQGSSIYEARQRVKERIRSAKAEARARLGDLADVGEHANVQTTDSGCFVEAVVYVPDGEDCLTCDLCGGDAAESDTYVIPDERIVCWRCDREWKDACVAYVQANPSLWSDVEGAMGRDPR